MHEGQEKQGVKRPTPTQTDSHTCRQRHAEITNPTAPMLATDVSGQHDD